MSGWVGAILNSVTNKSIVIVHLLNINHRNEDLKCSGTNGMKGTNNMSNPKTLLVTMTCDAHSPATFLWKVFNMDQENPMTKIMRPDHLIKNIKTP